MDKNRLIADFCDDTYATRQEVVKATQTTMVDPFWNQILEYRSRFARPVGLKTVDNEPYRVVITPAISEKINQLERKLSKALMRLSRLSPDDITAIIVRDNQYKATLKSVAKRYKLTPTDSFLHSVVRGNVSAPAVETMVLVNYFNALKYIETKHDIPLDEDYIGFLYEIMNGGAELTQFYRNKEVRDPSQRALVDRVYIAAPVSRIDDMMASLIGFVNNDGLMVIIRALFAYFYFAYIKPFEFYSEELAMLTLKSVLMRNDFEQIASLLNLEKILITNPDRMEMLTYEVKRSADFTYLLLDLLALFNSAIDELLDQVLTVEKQALIDENYQVEAAKPANDIPPQPLFSAVSKPVVEKEIAVEQELEIKEKSTPTAEVEVENPSSPVKEVSSESEERKEPVPELREQRLAGAAINYEQKLAVDALPIGLDEADAAKLEIHLREMDPTLKKGEAYFYARHCTLGKFYTIDQFKKTLNCAYETARTSMDHLVESGYYRKEQYKNKFIYTPVPRRR
ncbi:MAG: hypothetical protein WCX47_00145 [Bacilli bacterium]|jgi:Fic family protein|nr:hypothetical protein [Bacilli bacterium]MDD3388886.1 hypothetical protein [Bacilli bacterium]MDD4344660.1 hypothetical protein [Bacilli bacterium]MDD4520566.1 hypothetical protein [Bacilli bacterium]MDY0399258.1 hypothetical protein [Bacilli bacterium]